MRPDVMMKLVMSAADDGIDLGDGGVPPIDDVHEFYAWWLNENPMWFEHVASFWSHRGELNVLFVHYNDMQVDLDGQMRRVAGFLGVDVDEQWWPAMVERCTFESMKARSDEISDFDSKFVGGANTFLYKGTNGRWRDVLTADELAAFDRRSKQLLPPEAIAWTTSGDIGLNAQLL
jgi:aryl sulfotransferase